jgi:DNA-binding transcriptional MerR regulator
LKLENFRKGEKSLDKPQLIKELLRSNFCFVGISELSETCEVSTRQLRYWEKKGFIEAHTKTENGPRQYTMDMVAKVGFIKNYLDEGFTLTKAAEKAKQRIKELKRSGRIISKILNEIEIVDERFTAITFDDFEQSDDKIVLIHDDTTDAITYQVLKENEAFQLPTVAPTAE